MRLAVRERRKELHRLREHVSICDMVLINCLREQINGSLPSDERVVLNLFEASQVVRDEIGPIKSEYEPLEIMLGSKEHQLVEKYARIEGSFEHLFRLNIAPTTKPKEPSEIEYEASSVASAVDERASVKDTDHLHGALIGENLEIGQLPRHAGELKPSSRELWEPGGSHRRTVSLESFDIPRPRSSSFTDKKMSFSHLTSTLGSIGI
jgi:hypothetical protein